MLWIRNSGHPTTCIYTIIEHVPHHWYTRVYASRNTGNPLRIHSAVHATRSVFESGDCEAVLLVDASFMRAMLWIRYSGHPTMALIRRLDGLCTQVTPWLLENWPNSESGGTN